MEQPPIACIDLLRPGGLPRDPDSLDVTCYPRKRYHQIQAIVNNWLWLLHFPPNLQTRNKWYKRRENITIDDIVLIIDPLLPRSYWNMAIVEDTYIGMDGLVRSVKIRSKNGLYDRPITKLSLLLSNKEIEESSLKYSSLGGGGVMPINVGTIIWYQVFYRVLVNRNLLWYELIKSN